MRSCLAAALVVAISFVAVVAFVMATSSPDAPPLHLPTPSPNQETRP